MLHYKTAVVGNWMELESVGRWNVLRFQLRLTFCKLGRALGFTDGFSTASVSCQEFCTGRAECHAGISAQAELVPHRDFCTGRAGTTQGFLHMQSTTQGFLSEIKADSKRNGLLLLVANATEMAEQNKQMNKVTTLCSLALCSTSDLCDCDEFSLEIGPKPQRFLYIVAPHKC